MDADLPLTWYPLTAQQADFWHEFCAAPAADQGAVIHALRLTGPGNAAALAAAISGALAESDVLALRLSPAEAGALPMQAVDPRRRPALTLIDLRDTPAPETAARAWIEVEFAGPRDLMREPLSAHALMRLGDEDWLWAARAHHMMLDAYAMALIESRAAQHYRAAMTGAEPGPPLRPLADYLEDEARYLSGPQAAADRAAWRDILKAAPPLAVIPRGGVSAAPLSHHQTLPDRLGAGLAACGRALCLSWPDLLTLIAGAVLVDHPALPAINRQNRGHLTLWRAEMGRLGGVAAAVPALVVNLLPLPVTRGPDQSLPAFLQANASILRRHRRHARWRFERLADDLGIAVPNRPFISPFINVVPFAGPDFPGLAARREVLAAGPADGLNVTFRATPTATDLHMVIEADPALTAAADMHRLGHDLTQAIEQAITTLISDQNT